MVQFQIFNREYHLGVYYLKIPKISYQITELLMKKEEFSIHIHG